MVDKSKKYYNNKHTMRRNTNNQGRCSLHYDPFMNEYSINFSHKLLKDDTPTLKIPIPTYDLHHKNHFITYGKSNLIYTYKNWNANYSYLKEIPNNNNNKNKKRISKLRRMETKKLINDDFIFYLCQ